MDLRSGRHYTAFADDKKIAHGEVIEVAEKVKKFLTKSEQKNQILIFDDLTSQQLEVDFRGSLENVTRRLEARLPQESEKKSGPGRPKLGVISKEVTLLPAHWDWLALQPGGASVTLRKLIEDAKKKNFNKDQVRQSQEATYKFLTVMAGDLPHYEESLRALYAADSKKFIQMMTDWPKDIQTHALKLAKQALEKQK